MQSVSSTYKALLALPEHEFKVRVLIECNVYPSDAPFEGYYVATESDLISVTTSHQLFSDFAQPIGNACCGECDVELLYPPSPYKIPKMAEVKLEVCASGYIDGVYTESEWIPKGTFMIDERKANNYGTLKTLRIHCYDAMLKAERYITEYDLALLSDPVDFRNLIPIVSEALGVSIDYRYYPPIPWAPIYRKEWLIQHTFRELLCNAGILLAANFYITDRNTFRYLPLGCTLPGSSSVLVDSHGDRITISGTGFKVGTEETPDPINPADPDAPAPYITDKVFVGSSFESLQTDDVKTPITKIIITGSGNSGDWKSEYGYDGYTLHLESDDDRPYWGSSTAEIIYTLLNGSRSMTSPPCPYIYAPYECSNAVLDPAAELGDGVTISDYYSGLYCRETNFSGLMLSDISSPFVQDAVHEYIVPADPIIPTPVE